MDLEQQLNSDLSMGNTRYIMHEVYQDITLYDKLWEIVFNGYPPIQMRAAWVIEKIIAEFPEMFDKYYEKVISFLPESPDDGTRRILIKLFMITDVKKKDCEFMYNLCHKWYIEPSSAIAVKAYSLEVMLMIVRKIPELKEDLLLNIQLINENDPPALQSKLRHFPRILRKL